MSAIHPSKTPTEKITFDWPFEDRIAEGLTISTVDSVVEQRRLTANESAAWTSSSDLTITGLVASSQTGQATIDAGTDKYSYLLEMRVTLSNGNKASAWGRIDVAIPA
jgi:hypothetical protein